MNTEGLVVADPGKHGGFAYFQGTRLKLTPMPALESDAAMFLRQLSLTGYNRLLVERVGGFIGRGHQPGSRMFTFGWWAGGIVFAAMALKMEVKAVAPPVWQKALQVSKHDLVPGENWKDHLRREAMRIVPYEWACLDNYQQLAVADAALIHHWAQKDFADFEKLVVPSS